MNSEQPEKPDYLNNPIVQKYTHQLFHLVDDLHSETEGMELEEPVRQLYDILRTVFTRIVSEGEMAELDNILHMHFSIEYDPPGSDSIPSLTEYSLSTSN